MRNSYAPGNWVALCDVCGFKFKALDLKRDWRGLMVCKDDYELRHESDFLRVQKEKISVEFSRPYPVEDIFTGYTCSIIEIQPLADIATADCARVGLSLPYNTEGSNTLWINKDAETLAGAAAIPSIAIAGIMVAGRSISLTPEI